MFTLEARATQSAYASWLSPLLALALTAVTGALIFLAMGKSPGIALYIYFIEPLTSWSGLSEVAVKAGPLILIGMGLSLGFRAGVWNIGIVLAIVTLFGRRVYDAISAFTKDLCISSVLHRRVFNRRGVFNRVYGSVIGFLVSIRTVAGE